MSSQRAKKHVYQQFVSSTLAAKFRKLDQTWILELFTVQERQPMYQLWQKSTNYGKCKKRSQCCCIAPEARDSGSQESNAEDVADSMEEIFEPAGELEVEKDFETDEESKTAPPSTKKKGFPK